MKRDDFTECEWAALSRACEPRELARWRTKGNEGSWRRCRATCWRTMWAALERETEPGLGRWGALVDRGFLPRPIGDPGRTVVPDALFLVAPGFQQEHVELPNVALARRHAREEGIPEDLLRAAAAELPGIADQCVGCGWTLPMADFWTQGVCENCRPGCG